MRYDSQKSLANPLPSIACAPPSGHRRPPKFVHPEQIVYRRLFEEQVSVRFQKWSRSAFGQEPTFAGELFDHPVSMGRKIKRAGSTGPILTASSF